MRCFITPLAAAPDRDGERQQGAGVVPSTLKPTLSDGLSQRDTGWLQFYCETGRKVFDTIIQA